MGRVDGEGAEEAGDWAQGRRDEDGGGGAERVGGDEAGVLVGADQRGQTDGAGSVELLFIATRSCCKTRWQANLALGASWGRRRLIFGRDSPAAASLPPSFDDADDAADDDELPPWDTFTP